MGMRELDEGLRLVTGHPNALFVGPRDESVVQAAEEALGFLLPPTYRRFVRELGAGSIRGSEFYGVVSDDLAVAGVPNGVWVTLLERREGGLPDRLIVIGATGMGEWYVLDGRQAGPDGEHPVVVWVLGLNTPDDALELVAPDFGTFFLAEVQEALGYGR